MVVALKAAAAAVAEVEAVAVGYSVLLLLLPRVVTAPAPTGVARAAVKAFDVDYVRTAVEYIWIERQAKRRERPEQS